MCGAKNVPDTENALCGQGLGKGPVHSALRGADSVGGPDADEACVSMCDLPGLSVPPCEGATGQCGVAEIIFAVDRRRASTV